MGLLDDVREANARAAAERAEEARRIEREDRERIGRLPLPQRPAFGVELAQAFAEVGVPTIPLIENSPLVNPSTEPEQGWGMCIITRFISNMPVTDRQWHYEFLALSVTGRFWRPARYSIDLKKPSSGSEALMFVSYEDEFRSEVEMTREAQLSWTKLALRRQEEDFNAHRAGVVIGTRKIYDQDDPWG